MARMKQEASGDTSGDTVMVALKHPTGIVIEAFVGSEAYEPVMGGGQRKVKVFRPAGKRYTVNGNRYPFGTMPSYKIIAGYALTPGIPKDVWECWLSQHQDMPLVQNHLIHAHESVEYASDQAKDGQALRSGLEPLLTKGDPRVAKKRTRNGKFVDAIETGDEQPSMAQMR